MARSKSRLPEDAPFFVKDYYDYYKTDRGYHEGSLNSNGGWNVTSAVSFLNMPILQYSDEIRSAVLLIPGAVHADLYDRTDIIPFDKLVDFFQENLK